MSILPLVNKFVPGLDATVCYGHFEQDGFKPMYALYDNDIAKLLEEEENPTPPPPPPPPPQQQQQQEPPQKRPQYRDEVDPRFLEGRRAEYQERRPYERAAYPSRYVSVTERTAHFRDRANPDLLFVLDFKYKNFDMSDMLRLHYRHRNPPLRGRIFTHGTTIQLVPINDAIAYAEGMRVPVLYVILMRDETIRSRTKGSIVVSPADDYTLLFFNAFRHATLLK